MNHARQSYALAHPASEESPVFRRGSVNVTPSQLGAANRRRGIQAERDLARWLRGNGFPHAERAVRTGFRAADRTSQDPGDITGTPGIVWSVKDCAVEKIRHWMTELAAMGDGQADLYLLVHKRRGHGDVARWWCWTTLHDHNELVGAPPPGAMAGVLDEWPVRMELGHVAPMLRAAGYGDPAAPTLANPGRTAR